jgi:hypothetical protein
MFNDSIDISDDTSDGVSDEFVDPPFDDDEVVAPSPDEDPSARIWLYVLTRAVTKHRDQLLLLESGDKEFVPAFTNRQDAREFSEALSPADAQPDHQQYAVQAMHLVDLRKLAAEKALSIFTINARGEVLERWSPAGNGPEAS